MSNCYLYQYTPGSGVIAAIFQVQWRAGAQTLSTRKSDNFVLDIVSSPTTGLDNLACKTTCNQEMSNKADASEGVLFVLLLNDREFPKPMALI